MPVDKVPDIVVGRLPLYLRTLNYLMEEGYEIVSSHELGRRLGISPAQIRKDLSHFGEFGKQGAGYDVKYLSTQLKHILHRPGARAGQLQRFCHQGVRNHPDLRQ